MSYLAKVEFLETNLQIGNVLKMAIEDAALGVLAESPAVPARAKWARFALRNPEQAVACMKWGIALGIETANPTDAMLKARILAVWDAYAGG